MQASRGNVAQNPWVVSQGASQGSSLQQQVHYAAEEVDFSKRIQDQLDIADIEQELTSQNYKEKFHKLLCWEEKTHIDILQQR